MTVQSDHEWIAVGGEIPAAQRPSVEGEMCIQRWDGTTDVLEDPIGEILGLSHESYGTVIWSDNTIEVRGSAGVRSTDIDDIDRVETYPGGTALVEHSNGKVSVYYLDDMTFAGQFQGNYPKAGRISPTGAPVIVLRQNNNIVCYKL